MSSFNGEDLFGSGPCTFASGPRGRQWARAVDLGTSDPGLTVLGDHTLAVEVRGRLTAASAAALAALTDALEDQAGNKGDLIDDAGRTWEGITLVEVVYDGPPEVGRVWSVGYRVLLAMV
ncbi:MAG: hypothetical protein Q8L55_15960 [Phycisphaerales bacterium]|nr:hypothetical protein [Phycisphaerales bacterium]